MRIILFPWDKRLIFHINASGKLLWGPGWKMDMIAHIYGWIGLCGRQTQMEENHRYSLWDIPSKSKGSGQVVCTLNRGAAGRIWVWNPWDIVHNWKKSLQKQLHIVMWQNRAQANRRLLTFDWLPSFIPFNTKTPSLMLWLFRNETKELPLFCPAAWPLLRSAYPQIEFNAPLRVCICKYLSCETWHIIAQEKSGGRQIFLCQIKGKVAATTGLCHCVGIVPSNEAITQACCSTLDCIMLCK